MYPRTHRRGHRLFMNLAATVVVLSAMSAARVDAGREPADTGSQPADIAREPVWVFFADKGLHSASDEKAAIDAAARALSPRAAWRRAKVRGPGIADYMDVPVNARYMEAVLATGATHRTTSRWLNAISVEATGAEGDAIRALPFVSSLRPVARGRRVPETVRPVTVPETPSDRSTPLPAGGLDYGECSSQILPIQVNQLHDAGYSGTGIIVALMDTGFEHDTHVAVQDIDVLAEHDFIHDDDITRDEAGEDIPGQHYHGSYCLSLIGGFDPGNLIGPAYGARYVLAKTEDTGSETPVEEDYWAEAAEWADSLGADVISTSLGYYDWFTYSDMDGDTSVSTIAGDLAAANGIAVFAAAGNQGSTPWYYIGAPADGDSVMAVGAVDSIGMIQSFSSHGPTYDGRTKPDICAMGHNDLVALVGTVSDYGRGSGTSFACPLAAGVGALLLQAHPQWTPMRLRDALRATADHAAAPDQSYGWGVIRGMAASGVRTDVPATPAPEPGAGTRIRVSPNPSSGPFTIRFAAPESAGPVRLDIVDVRGRVIREVWSGAALGSAAGTSEIVVRWDGLDADGNAVPQGLYYARASAPASVVRPIVVLR